MYLVNDPKNLLYSNTDFDRFYTSIGKRSVLDARDDFERDHGRIVHSSAFRRLQAKTQVIGPQEGDFHRTRLTHSMEVAQIARGIAIHLNKNSEVLREVGKLDISLVEAAALAHDFGHPPFGHQGERALNEKMNKFGGFEGNAQTFRILTRLEGNKKVGLNLTRATLLSILKYPVVYEDAVNEQVYSRKENNFKPPKTSVFLEDKKKFDWLLQDFNNEEKEFLTSLEEKRPDGNDELVHRKTINKTFECSIIELADDIAYATHDLEDALKLKLIDIRDLQGIFEEYKGIYEITELSEQALGINPKTDDFTFQLKEFFAKLISILITNIEVKVRNFINSPRLRYSAVLPSDLNEIRERLNSLVKQEVILSQRVQTIEWKGGQIIRRLFDAMMNDKNLLPKKDREGWGSKSERERARQVCDYIAGMTDSYAAKMYARLFEANAGRLFDI